MEAPIAAGSSNGKGCTSKGKGGGQRVEAGTREPNDRQWVAETVVGDETGVISMKCTADQANILSQAEVVSIVNARTQIFHGRMHLEVDKRGHIEAVMSRRPMFVNTSVDVSSVEYELVMYPQ